MMDDDPHYRLYATKLAAPYFLGVRQIPGLHFPERLKVCRRLAPSDFAGLPDAFVVKSNFGSGLNRVVKDRAREDLDALCDFFNTRLAHLRNAQGRNDPDNCVIIEEFLSGADGESPDDLKFHCFHRADGSFYHIFQFDTQRAHNHEQSLFDEKFERLPFRFGDTPQHATAPRRPAFMDEAIRIVRAASQGFDYVRMDLYAVQNKLYFGEFTPFHQGGKGRIDPPEWDVKLGQLWDFRMPAYRQQTAG